MTHLVIQPTITAEWQTLVKEGEKACHTHLTETLQSYLVFLLIRFMKQTELATSVLALEWLATAYQPFSTQQDTLQTIGDKCLLFSGFYPKHSEQKHVKIDYFVHMGQTAYSKLSEAHARGQALLFSSLCHHFVKLMDILQAMRELSGEEIITPLMAMELWSKVGSEHAFRLIRRCGAGTPVPPLDNPRLN
ncbi:MAG: hypothetical protein HY559_05920 [Gammaproteobacteria bacterium]|nr:hypothetical protein [Gammaproteobacteria bacterium]